MKMLVKDLSRAGVICIMGVGVVMLTVVFVHLDNNDNFSETLAKDLKTIYDIKMNKFKE